MTRTLTEEEFTSLCNDFLLDTLDNLPDGSMLSVVVRLPGEPACVSTTGNDPELTHMVMAHFGKSLPARWLRLNEDGTTEAIEEPNKPN